MGNPDLDAIVARALADLRAAPDAAALENAKARYLGKSGELSAFRASLGSLPAEERRTAGQNYNSAVGQIEAALDSCRKNLESRKIESRLAGEALDVTLPGRGRGRGGVHPISRTWRRIEEIFRSIGFDVADGPEIETDWYNFTALNNPENHPARSMQDTFYVDLNDGTGGRDGAGLPLLLRTHTSPMQV
ncbi:MAG TPA: phenylalanine--tRNA ligase subunit alpha, partial [Burkholderiales bacterium]|nr:phenylalanine--tRNA ligase subunit alpha [Burkholderiales bacterium]